MDDVMKEIYRSATYSPDRVTGRYVRVEGRKGNYQFKVIEAATGTGRFAGKPGHGPTLREYMTDGDEIPQDVKESAIASKQTEKWS
ncbi:hypothetical protein G6M87_11050 [Rhizobium rhizogenes]|nr:hypothetical protein [Rhizobium rhizogenes]QTG05980.1 hypothetical protein G6M87_11050 [Rhizobium rhizogenes]